MNRIVLIPAVICASLLFQGGCASTGQIKQVATPANVQIGIAVLSTGVLNALNPADRVKVAQDLYGASVGIRTLEGGEHVPSPEEIRAVLAQFLPKAAAYGNVIQVIVTGWNAALPQIPNVQKAQVWLEAVAAGLESAAKPYLTVPHPDPTI